MLTQSTFFVSKYRLSIELLRLQSIATQKCRLFTRSYTRECRFFEPTLLTIRIFFSNSVGSKNRIRGKRVYIIFVPGGMNFGPLKYVNETFSRDEKFTLLHYSRSLIGRKSWIRLRPISDHKKWSKLNFLSREEVSFPYFTGSKFIPLGISMTLE